MIRGIDRQIIFKDEEDYEKFRTVFNKFRKQYGIRLLAWCMIPNHVHLLIKDTSDSLSLFFRLFGSNYVNWYNKKYNRVGHLFQDRFRSEAIGDTAYLLKAIRYIHLNPVKAGICSEPSDYRYSSYSYYFTSGRYKKDDLLFGATTMDVFEKFHREKNDDQFPDIDENIHRITDKKIIQLVMLMSGSNDISRIGVLSDEKQMEIVRMLKDQGVSIHQINRVTGISCRSIQKIYLRKSL